MSAETSLHTAPQERRGVLPRLAWLFFIVALIGLILTGLPQKFAGTWWSHYAFVLMGGIESTRILHRFFSLLLIAASVYHALALLYRVFVLNARRENDGGNAFIGAIRQFLGNIGLNRAPSDTRFALRLEYWVIVFSVILMAITGLALWKPVAVTNILPAETIPLFRSLHGDHALALLAFLVVWRIAIVVLWHPKRPAQPVAAASAETIASRSRVFVPVALIVSVVLAGLLFVFITSTQTAINTVIPHEAVIYAPQAMPETGDPNIGAALWQTLRCAFCHGSEAQGGADDEPALMGTDLTFDSFYQQTRLGSGELMPAFSREDLPDAYVFHLYTWLTQPGE